MTNQAAQTMPELAADDPIIQMRMVVQTARANDALISRAWVSGWADQWEAERLAALSQTAGVPDVLFDGYAVYQGMSDEARARINAGGVSDVLDSVVRLIRAQAAPAASGGECQHEWTTVGRGGVPKRELACMKCGRHRDHMAAPQLPSAASVSERARELLAEAFSAIDPRRGDILSGRIGDPNIRRALRALEQALTQQRGEAVAWQMRCRYWDGAPWSEWQTFPSNEARELDWAPYKDSQWLRETRELYTTPQPSADAARKVPDGMVLVPREPTREMIEAGVMFGNSPNKVSIIYQSMVIAAASDHQQNAAQGGGEK